MVTIGQCPICSNPNLQEILHVKDYSVSGEVFSLRTCKPCDLIITSPRPDDADLPSYYESTSYVSHQDDAGGIINIMYRAAKHYTLRWKFNLIKIRSTNENKSVLDIGCGTGSFLHFIKQRGFNVQGVEPSENARQQAEKKLTQRLHSDLKSVQGSFGVITMWHVLEHVPSLNDTIQHVKFLMENNGMLLIAVPNHQSFDAKTYGDKWAAYDVPRHLWHFTPTSMNALVNKHALRITEIIPMKLDAFYVSMLSEKYQGSTGISGMLKGMRTGMRSNINSGKEKKYSSLVYCIRK